MPGGGGGGGGGGGRSDLIQLTFNCGCYYLAKIKTVAATTNAIAWVIVVQWFTHQFKVLTGLNS
jgi:hypothetical protein